MQCKRRIILLFLMILCSLTACKNVVKEYRKEGITALEKGDAKKALENFNLALDKSKGQVGTVQFDILLYKVEAEIHLGKLGDAAEDLKNVETLSGKKYEKLTDLIKAKKCVQSAGEALNKEDLSSARKYLDEAKAKGLTNDRELEYNEAVYLEKAGEWKKAYEAFTQYSSRYPEDSVAEREVQFLENRVKELENNALLSEGKQ